MTIEAVLALVFMGIVLFGPMGAPWLLIGLIVSAVVVALWGWYYLPVVFVVIGAGYFYSEIVRIAGGKK